MRRMGELTVGRGTEDDVQVRCPRSPLSTPSTTRVTAANDTKYGPVGYVYTNELRRALRVVEALHVGMVGVNQGTVSNASAPFGGVKQSGIGREGGYEGIGQNLETKYAAIDL